VTAALPGLAPGTIFHYRLVSSHGPTATTYGGDMTFETLPWPRRHTVLDLGLRRRPSGRKALRVTASGTIVLAATTTTALGCNGTVTVGYYAGNRKLATSRALVGPHCGYSTSARIRYGTSALIRVRASFSGNVYQAPVDKSGLVKVTR
jgi:hypothetical protein